MYIIPFEPHCSTGDKQGSNLRPKKSPSTLPDIKTVSEQKTNQILQHFLYVGNVCDATKYVCSTQKDKAKELKN